MVLVQCPNCSIINKFPPDAMNQKGRCKNPACLHVWRLTTTLPAVRNTPPSVPAAYRTEAITRTVAPGVIRHEPVAMPEAVVQAIVQVEFYCARRDEPFSALYVRRSGETLFQFQRGERGTHAIDRYCGTEAGQQYFARSGGAVHYDRTIHSLDYQNLRGFSCAWCDTKDWFHCGGCGHLICKGSSYKTWAGKEFGVCRRSCPAYNAEGGELGPAEFSISVRQADLSWDQRQTPALPSSGSGLPQIRGRS